MARRLGPYAPLSATYAADDAIIEAGERAELLYVRALAFCASSNSDGYITDAQLARYVGVGMADVAKRAQRLAEVGLWERGDGGYTVRAWLKWNTSAEDLGRSRARDRERKRAGRPDAVPPDPPPDSGPPSDRIPDGIHAESDRSPNGVQSESSGIPPRAPTRAAAQASAQPPAHPGHCTSLNGTELHRTHPPVVPPPAAPPDPPRSRGTRLPDDWAPDSDLATWTLDAGLDRATARYELEKFRDHWHAAAGQRGVKRSWDATWRNWVRKAVEQQTRNVAGRESHYERNRRILRDGARAAGDDTSVVELFGRKAIE